MNQATRILIVEDKPADADLAKYTLQKALKDCEFQVVETRQDFLHALEVFQPDVILSDYSLPRFDGLKALKLVLEHAPLIPLIIWTGSISEDVAVECMKAGANNYILKNNIKRLGPAVLHALEERRLLLERKRAEEKIQNSEKRFRALIENGLDDISLLAADGTLLWESPSIVHNLGYPPDTFVGRNIFELMHPDDLERTHRQFGELVQELGSRERGGFRLRHADGTWRWVEAIATNMLNEPGVQAIVINYRDVTERRQAEKALHDSEQRYRALFEDVPIAIWEEDFSHVKKYLDSLKQQGVTDFHTYFAMHPDAVFQCAGMIKILDVNNAAVQMFQAKSKEQLIEITAQELSKGETEHVHEVFIDIAEGKTSNTWEGPDETLTGRPIEISLSWSIAPDNQDDRFRLIVTTLDVTERKQAEEAFRRNEAILAQAGEIAHLGAWTIELGDLNDINSNPLQWSDEVYRIFGYEPGEVKVTNALFHEHVHPDDRQRVMGAIAQSLAQKKPYQIEHRVVWNNGTVRIVLEHAEIIFDERDRPVRILGAVQDITERKQVEEALRESEARYRTLIETQTDFIVRWKPDSGRTFANKAYCKYFGLTSEQANSTSFMPLVYEDDRPAIEEKIHRLVSGITNVETDIHRVLRSDGQIGWQEWTDQVIRDEQGQLVELQSVGRDVTARRQAELERHTLLEIMQGLANTSDLQELLELIHHSVAKVIYARNLFVVLYNEEDGLFEEIYCVDQYDSPASPSKLEKSITSYVFRSGEPLLLTPESFSQLVAGGEIELVGTDSASWLGVPLKTSGKTIGVIAVQDYEKDNRYSERDKEFLASIASQIALAIHHRQAIEAVRESETRYRLATQATKDVIWEWTSEDNQLIWTENGQHVFGYAPEEIPAAGWWDEHIHPEDRERVASKLNSLIATAGGESVWEDQYRFQLKNGSYAYIDDHAYIERDSNGMVFRMIGAMANITERKQAEEALYKSEALYRQAIEVAGAVPYLESYYDEGQKIHYEFIGEGIRQITGYGPQDFTASLWDSLVEEVHLVEDLAGYSLEEGIERVRNGEHSIWKCEHRLRDRYGKIHWVFEAAVELRDENGGSHGSIGTYQDITERKQAEEAEREQRALAEALRDTAETLNSSLSYEEVLDHILSTVGRVVPHDAATIMLMDGEDAEVVRSYGYDKRQFDFEVIGIRLPLAQTTNLRQMLESKQPEIVYDTHSYPGWMRFEATDWLRSNVGAPISIQGKVIGFISLDSQSPKFFTPAHAERLEAFANQAALAIHNARLLQQAQEEIAERKQAELTLQRAEAKYRFLVEQIPAAVYLWELGDGGRCHYISPQIETMLGFSVQEWLTDPDLFFRQVHPEDRERAVAAESYSRDTGEPLNSEFRMLTRESRVIWVHDEAVVIPSDSDQIRLNQGVLIDITERKQAEEELRASEERFRQLADNIQEAFWMTDAENGEEIYLSSAAESIWGRPTEVLMHEHDTFINSVFPEDQPAILQAIEKEKHGEKVEIEYRIVRPDGLVRWIWDRAFPIFDETGRVKRIAGISADITERREAEIALIKSRSRYRELFDSSPISIWEEDYSLVKQQIDLILEGGVTDLEEFLNLHPDKVLELASLVRITDANKAALELYSLEKKNAVSKSLDQVLSPDALRHFQEEIVGFMSPAKRFMWEGSDKLSNGRHIDVIVNGSIPEGYEEDWSKAIVSIIDITERRQAEQQLRKLSRAVEQSASTIVITDASGNIEYVNPKFTEITGYSLEEVIGQNPRLLKSGRTPQQDYEQLWQTITDGREWRGELLNKKKDGSLFWELVTVSPVLNERGEITHFVEVKEDVTRHKEDEMEIHRRADEFTALYETARELAMQYNLPTLLNAIAERARALLRSPGGGVYLYDQARGDLEMVLAVGSSVPAGARLKLGEGMAGRVAQTRQLLNVDDYRTWEGQALQYEVVPFRAVLQAPMLYGGELIGVLVVHELDESERKYSEADAHLLTLFAEYAASAVHAARLLQETRRRAEETSALLQTSLALTNLDLKATLQTIGNSAKTLFAADGCRVFLTEPDGKSLRCVMALQKNFIAFSNLKIKIGEGVTGAVAASGQAEIVNEMQNDPRSVQVPGTEEKEPEAIMFAPLKERDSTIGVLSIRRAGTKRPFQSADLGVLEAFASMAASAVSNARLFEETQRRLAELEALYENGLAVGRLLKTNEIGNRIIDTFARYLQWHHVTIRLRKEETDDLELVAINLPGLTKEEKAEMEKHFSAQIKKIGQGLSGWVIQTGMPFRTSNVHNHPQYIDTQAGIQSGLYMPLKVGEQAIGVISVESVVPDAFTEQDERLLATLANQAAIAFENARLYEAIQKELSERKRAEQALRVSEVHYRELADSITDILFELDQDLRYTHWNRASEIFLGIPANEAIGKSMQEVFGTSEEQLRREEIYRSVLKERRPRTFETEALAKGQKRALEITAYPSARGVSVVAKDVTERKRSEIIMQKRFELMEFSAHHSLEELMQKTIDEVNQLTDSSMGFLHFVDEDQVSLRLQTWSTEVVRDFQVPSNEGHHRALDQAGLWAEAARQRRPLIHNDYESLSQNREMPQGHLPVTREVVIPIIRNERIMAIMGIANKPKEYTQSDLEIAARLADYAWDITERKQMELVLEAERNQLARRVDERTADLSRANSNLARALRVKDEFLANMSHELRTPLNAILGLSESLGEQIAGPLNEKQQKYISTISESGHHLLSLINDILDLAKIDAGQITLDINKVDIRSVCQASLRMIKQLAQKKHQEVSLEIDEGLGLIWADERRLKQMLVNLLGNAVKFTPENGKLGLEVHGDEEANQISFAVWDKGVGIREEDLVRLFQPFVQLDSGLARETTGTGLGLALVAQMARLHGGSIQAVSEPENGSRFTVVLPWEPALALDAATRMKITGKFRAIKLDEKNKPSILLVEDTQEVTMMIKDYLELAGYKVVTAQDGVDAIVQAKLVKPDLILMDVQMPRMDGLEATRKLRSEPDFRYTPIIALTALAMSGDRERCLEAGMDEYISKPVNLKTLIKMIQGCLFSNQEVKSR